MFFRKQYKYMFILIPLVFLYRPFLFSEIIVWMKLWEVFF